MGSLGFELGQSLLALVEGLGADLAFLFELLDNILVLPTDLGGNATEAGVLATGLEAENTEGLGNNHALHFVVGRRDALKDFDIFQSLGTTSSLMGDHTAEGTVEDAGGGAEMEGTVGGLDKGALLQVFMVADLVAEERARDVHLLAADDNDTLAVQDQLGDGGSQTTKQVTLAVNNVNLEL